MGKVSSVQKKLKEMLTSLNFGELKTYQDPTMWESMSTDERELLGNLFVMQGKDQLEKGDKSGLKAFDMAAKAAPKNAEILYQKGLAYSLQDNNKRCLASACRAFEKATKLKPEYIDAWLEWAYSALHLGKMKADPEILHGALDKFERAESLLKKKRKGSRATMNWHWGHCWHMIGKLSGEAIDLSKALDKYKKADSLGLDMTEFWIDYGNAFAEQASLLGKSELFLEVVELFQKAVERDPEDFEAWLSIACSYMRLYEDALDEDYFYLANDAFDRASEIFSGSSSLYLCWGQLLLASGKFTHDMDKVFEAAIKFEQADECERDHPVILCRWSEALMNLGSVHDSYQMISEAHEKIKRSAEIDSDSPETWYFYGRCLVEMGRYFSDTKYYIEGIEKYQHGFSLDKSLKLFHYGMGIAYFELSSLSGDESAIRQALKHYSQLEEEADQLPPQFWVDWGHALFKYGENSMQKHYVEAAMHKYEEAMSILGDDVEKEPLLIDCLYHYGLSLDLLGDMYDEPTFYEKSIQIFSYLMQVNPGFLVARYHLALSYSHLGELVSDVEYLQRSSEEFEAIVQEDPENEMVWNDWGVTLLNLANLVCDPSKIEYTEQLYSMAEARFHNAVALGNVGAYYNIAGYYSLVGNFHAAMEFLEKAYQAQAIPSVDDIMHDEWLDQLRHTDEFRNFLSKLLKN